MRPDQRPGVARINPGPRNVQAPQRVILADFTDQALSDLKSAVKHDQKAALGRLKNAPPSDRREEVAKAIEPLLKDPDGFLRSEAAKALGVWGGPENVPALLAMLKDPAFHVRWAVLDALKELHDPSSAEALARYLMTSNDRGKTVDALRAIGPPAEEAVLRCLTHPDGFVRMDVCKLLGAIGTRKSIPALRRVAQGGHGLDVMAAREALNQLDRAPDSFR